jgi:uncharacterized protein
MRQEVVQEPQPEKPGDFASDDYLKFAVREGTIHTRTGFRAFLAGEDFIVSLQQGLESELGDGSARVLYKCGYKWGQREMRAFVPLIEKEYNKKLQELGAAFFLEQWWLPLQAEGWGTWKLDMTQRRQGMIFIDLFNSAIAGSIGQAGKPVCHLYAGLFAGVFAYLTKNDLSGIEVQCDAAGDDFCKFIIGTEKRIDAAEFWLREGASAREIIAKLSG